VVIRNGIKLYSGRVDEMTSSFGVIELNTENQTGKLIKLLQDYDGIASIKVESNLIHAILNKDISAADLNKFCLQNEIVLSHLTKRKPTLEQQFLTLTNNA